MLSVFGKWQSLNMVKNLEIWLFTALVSGELRSVPGFACICMHLHLNDVILACIYSRDFMPFFFLRPVFPLQLLRFTHSVLICKIPQRFVFVAQSVS